MSDYIGICPDLGAYDPTDKVARRRDYIRYMLARTQQMWRYEGLPDTIPPRMLEMYLQCNGVCIIAEHEGKLYALTGGWGGPPDPYYRPTKYIVANPALKLNKEYTIGDDCVLCGNDSYYMGLLPMYNRYADKLVESDITLRLATINMRSMYLLSAADDNTKKACDKVIKDIESGKLGAIATDSMWEGITNLVNSTPIPPNYVTQLVEQHQYILGSWYNDLGLNASINMKREKLTDGEVDQNNDIYLPLVDDMLHRREEMVKQVNEKYGTNISVSLSSSWEDRQIQEELAQQLQEAQIEQLETPAEPQGKEENPDED